MEAGHGAEEQMARHARRAERLRRELAATRDAEGAVAAALERARRQERAWAAGAEGERMVAGSLDVLRRYGWTFLHDVRWPGRQHANIDHIAVGPGGIAVIDAENWTGTVRAADGTLRQNGYRRERELEGVSAATAAVTALLEPMHRSATIGMLCLAGQEQEPTATAAGVPVVGRHQLAEALLELPPRLSPYEVADIGRFLARQLGDDRPASARRASARRASGTRASGTRASGTRASGTRHASMPDGPLVDPSPRPIRPAGRARPGSAARGRGGRGGRSSGRRGGGTSFGGTLLRLALVVVGLLLLIGNAGSISEAYLGLFLPDSATTEPVPAPAGTPTVPDPADPAAPRAVDPGAGVPVPEAAPAG